MAEVGASNLQPGTPQPTRFQAAGERPAVRDYQLHQQHGKRVAHSAFSHSPDSQKSLPSRGLATFEERPYRTAYIVGRSGKDEHVYDPRYASELMQLMMDIINAEAPITINLLARRVAGYWGFQKSSAKLRDRILRVLEGPSKTSTQIVFDDNKNCIYLSSMPPSALTFYRVPTSDEKTKRLPEDIPLPEIRIASHQYRGLALSEDEFFRRTAAVLGFSRLGENVRQRMALASGRTEGARARCTRSTATSCEHSAAIVAEL